MFVVAGMKSAGKSSVSVCVPVLKGPVYDHDFSVSVLNLGIVVTAVSVDVTLASSASNAACVTSAPEAPSSVTILDS